MFVYILHQSARALKNTTALIRLRNRPRASSVLVACLSSPPPRTTMEIVNANFGLLSNFEVQRALKQISDTKKKFGLRNLATISYETIRYLEDSPAKTQTATNIQEFLRLARPYKLTRNEQLMMINDPPTSALHIQLQVEDSEERLTEDQVRELLDAVRLWLLPKVEE